MYLTFYNLKREPFSLSPDHNFLYLSEVHKEGLAHLRYCLIRQRGFVLITGEVGTGKTTLIHALLAQVPQKVKTVFISNPSLKRDEFFELLAHGFGLGVVGNKGQFIIKFTQFLEEAQKRGEHVLLIIDEAHCLSPDILEEIRLLSNLETPNVKLISIILVGQPEFKEIIENPQNRALRQRISLFFSLRPLSRQETADYIRFRLMKAGAKDLAIFSETALDSIFLFSQGVPRLINKLADHALLTGFVKEVKYIDDKIIKECAKEAGIVPSDSSNDRPHVAVKKGRIFSSKLVAKFFVAFSIVATISSFLLWYFVLDPEEKRQIMDLCNKIIFQGKLWGK